jgi:predicted hydrocarbon binding protein
MRFVKISKEEFGRSARLYEGVMAQACYGLYYREGQVIGEELAKLAQREGDEYFRTLEKLLVGRGWVDEAELGPRRATFKGSMEASVGVDEGCHRLRGIVKAIYEMEANRKLTIVEIECQGQGGKACVFSIEGFGEVL